VHFLSFIASKREFFKQSSMSTGSSPENSIGVQRRLFEGDIAGVDADAMSEAALVNSFGRHEDAIQGFFNG
jgi:hypothetical protein